MTDYTLLDVYRSGEFELSRQVLTDFVGEQADLVSVSLGFTYKPVPDAPGTFAELRAAFKHSVRTGEPLPISDEHSESVIYTTPEANTQFRFWHDCAHVHQRLDFGVTDELELAMWHVGQLEGSGFTEGSMPWRMFHADVVGQVHLMAYTRQFPCDQLRFVGSCVLDGIELGLLHEHRRQLCPDDKDASDW